MTGPHNILIVEDEPLIAMMLEDFLEILDKVAVGSADCVSAAMGFIEAGGIDAAILDLNLRGGETSLPIADALAAANIPFVFATGGSQDSVPDRFRGRPSLAKPFTMDGVAKALEALA